MEYPKFKVCVRCFTYNQSKYITDALNGFVMQQTDFPFVCCIVDDASTDGEQEVIRRYVEENFDTAENSCHFERETDYAFISYSQHKINKSCYFVVLYLKDNLYSKKEEYKKIQYISEWEHSCDYVALCEGDDYWIDATKIQNQVDVLDSNPFVYLVYTDYDTVDQNHNYIYRKEYEDGYKLHSQSGDILPILFKTNFPLTVTLMVRKEVFTCELYRNAPVSLDYLICVSAAFIGDCVYFPEKTSAYRLNPSGMMHTQQHLIAETYKRLHKYLAIEYAKGIAKKETICNHFSIIQTIVCRFLNDKEMIRNLIITDKRFLPIVSYYRLRSFLSGVYHKLFPVNHVN